MNTRLNKNRSLCTEIGILGLAVLAGTALLGAANYTHVRGRSGKSRAALGAAAEAQTILPKKGIAPVSIRPEQTRSVHQLPVGAAPVISATLGQHDPQY